MKVHTKGYFLVRRPSHPFARSDGYIPIHRLVAEATIGRPINPQLEDVHHKDGCVTNNAPENLEVLTKREHRRTHAGWLLAEGVWHKTCPSCQRFLPVEGNFYKRRTGHTAFVSNCINCCVKSASEKRAAKQFGSAINRAQRHIFRAA